MKKIIFTITMFGCGFAALAQKSTSKFILSINGGIASPVGNFAKGDYADEKSGFAKTGPHFNLAGTYYLNKNWGVGMLVGYSQFCYKGSQSLSDGYKEDSGTDSTTLYQKGTNHSLSILIGPYYRLDAGKKISIDIRLLGGYVNTHLAGFQIFYEDYTDNAMTQKESSAGAFGIQAGVGVQYHITNNLSVQINGDYFTSKPDIPINYENFVVNSGRRLSSYNESISGINATIGFAYRLF